MARAGSINYQVSNIIKAHNGIGLSKLESRNTSGLKSENGHKVSDKFHSYKSLDNARADLTNLGKFAKEQGIKDMSKIDKVIVKEWLNSKDITYNTASNYISELNKIHEHMSFTKAEMKELRAEVKQEHGNTSKEINTRAYKGLEKIQLPERSQVSFELQRDYGLRVSAATHINLDKQLQGNTFSYQEKGGKWSEKELNPTLASNLRENAVNGKYELNNKTYSRDLQKEIEKSGQKYNGTHGIRHTYAQKELEAGKSKQEVSQAMGHSREEITNTYLR